jgi:hypothetical protein
MKKVTVDADGLAALISYADAARVRVDGEFCCSRSEHEESQREFDDLIARLEITAG